MVVGVVDLLNVSTFNYAIFYFILGVGSYISTGWSQNPYGHEDGLRLLILLVLFPECPDYRVVPPWPDLYIVGDLT